MSLITFAVIGKDKSPIYLRDFDKESETDRQQQQQQQQQQQKEASDPFGFCELRKNLNESSSLKNQVREALARLTSDVRMSTRLLYCILQFE